MTRAASVAEIFDRLAWGPAPEAAEPALARLDRHGRSFGHFIDNQWRPGQVHLDVFNPANRQVLARVAHGTREDVDAALAAARRAVGAGNVMGAWDRETSSALPHLGKRALSRPYMASTLAPAPGCLDTALRVMRHVPAAAAGRSTA